jgi:serine/threonine protein phosphatase PrpC
MLRNELAQRIEHFLTDQPPGRNSRSAHGLAVSSSQGAFRGENQDRALIGHISGESEGFLTVALVCDGMGGMVDGGGAAASAVSAFLSCLADPVSEDLEQCIYFAVLNANRDVFQRYKGGGGSTLSAIVRNSNNDVFIAHVGDSRVYVKRGNGDIELLTQDDTVAGQVRRVRPDIEAELDNRLLQFIGIGKNIEPHVFKIYAEPRDTYLITSDGGHSIGRRALERVFLTSSTSLDLVRKITYVADAIGVEDNSSAVALSLYDISSPPQFYSGTSISLWSSTDQLEIWFEMAAQSSPQRVRKPMLAPASHTRKAKGLKKASKGSSKPRKEQSALPEKPQLRIEFDKNGGSEND